MNDEPFDPLSFVILEILHARNAEPIRNKTVLQKIAFLSLRNFNFFFQLADFKAHKFGPFSPSISKALEQLRRTNDIRVNKGVGHQISEKGKNYLNNFHKKLNDKESLELDKKLERVISNVKEDFNNFTVNQMLAFIYKSYPKYIDPSIKANQLNYENIFLKMYEEGKIGISKIAELMKWPLNKTYEFIKKNAKTVLLK
jgi:uncharacterized protein YwgA